jgi:hypothetical protein
MSFPAITPFDSNTNNLGRKRLGETFSVEGILSMVAIHRKGEAAVIIGNSNDDSSVDFRSLVTSHRGDAFPLTMGARTNQGGRKRKRHLNLEQYHGTIYNPNHEECDGRGCSAQIIVIEGI